MDSRRLRSRLLATLSDAQRFEGFRHRLAEFAQLDPEGLRALVRRLEMGGPCLEPSPPGVHALPVKLRARAGLLVCMHPGARFVSMRRTGEGFVLAGAGAGPGGVPWLPGDIRSLRAGEVLVAERREALLFVWSAQRGHRRVS